MPESKKLTKQEIYQKIRESSKEEFILTEMKRLGFWDDNKDKPTLAEEFIQQRTELQQKLRQLGQQQRLYQDPELALKKLHEERKKNALEKRELTRQKHNQQRYDRALAWHQTLQTTIPYLGEGVSQGLQQLTFDDQRLTCQDLPRFTDSAELANTMGINLNELRFLCFQKEVSRISHYRQFTIAKKTGGTRRISAPMPRLKRIQYWLLNNVLARVAIHSAAHGFAPGHSILSNALPHVGKAVVINIDLQDFFPTITYPRVKGLFQQLGYSEQIATLFALITTEAETESLTLDNEIWYVQQEQRRLPQGAPTSPAISNLICRRLDSRLTAMATKLGFHYTRYADDLTFSSADASKVQQLLWRCKQIVRDEGFIPHPDKTQVMRRNRQQTVTGIVVNQKPSIDRKKLKRFRALLFQLAKDGLDGKQWGPGDLIPSIEGYANFVAMVAPEKGIPLQQQVAQLKQQYGYQLKVGRISTLNKKRFRAKSALGQSPRENWWQTVQTTPPELEKTTQQRQAEQQSAVKTVLPAEPVATTLPSSTTKTEQPANQIPRQSRTFIWLLALFVLASYFYMR